MIRHKAAAAVLLVFLASCSSTYRVKREDLTRAPEIIPAVAEDGRETWISSEAIKNPRETELPAYVDVDVSDRRRTLIATGGAIALYGLIGVAGGLVMMNRASRPGDEPYEGIGEGLFALSIVGAGGLMVLTGGGLALAGVLTGPPEQPAPPAAQATAPPRR